MARIILCRLLLRCHRCCMAGQSKTRPRVSLSAAAAVGSGRGIPSKKSSPTCAPSVQRQARRLGAPQGLGGGCSGGANNPSSPLRGAYPRRDPSFAFARRCWDGGNLTPRDLARPAGRALGRQVAWVSACAQACACCGLVHCHLLNPGIEGSKGWRLPNSNCDTLYSQRHDYTTQNLTPRQALTGWTVCVESRRPRLKAPARIVVWRLQELVPETLRIPIIPRRATLTSTLCPPCHERALPRLLAQPHDGA
jgi:hypothetical protein